MKDIIHWYNINRKRIWKIIGIVVVVILGIKVIERIWVGSLEEERLYMMQENKEEKAISMEEFYSGELGVQSVLGIGMNMYQDYLDQLAKEGFIDLNRTAGLDMIYKLKYLSKEEIALHYYEKVRE